ncbi:NAD(P)-dependent oxidoreductase [Methylacidimicrobium tartarophylax]|uniref:3-hydroxyisobutyrate dehydrogenase n=1 Tax=Methylacidimicrobium tartarophylax TaxID=1041768 RepID=A0A5E6M564_9BACT|nr:NAD(P)-dependent oxidoreductase [Methylacidimicrobium tartarophylax]VVM04478.1 3-hydroxyisobutyrate dehydrogenase [Methylacidimicrobium tartarophylax]
MRIGFVGLGRMGSAMAARLLAVGGDLKVWNRSLGRTEPLQKQGADVARDLRDFADREVVFTMLSDDAALRAVVLGDPGLLAILQEGAIHVSCSTITVALSEELGQRHRERRQEYLALPVFGRPEAAAAGKLVLVVGGKLALLDRLRPLLAPLGQQLFHVGERPEQANLVKLSGNFLLATVIESLGESMALVEKGGIDRHAYLELLTSTLFSAPVYRTYGGLIANRSVRPAAFLATLGQKDLRLAMEAADALRVPMPFAGPLRDRFLALAARGETDVDWAAIGIEAAREAGLDPAKPE